MYIGGPALVFVSDAQLEILKLVGTFFFGGAAGQLLAEWFRRRSGKLQTVALIERVNRQVSPDLKGITLARVMGAAGNRQLQEIRNLREYQLTLRNTFEHSPAGRRNPVRVSSRGCRSLGVKTCTQQDGTGGSGSRTSRSLEESFSLADTALADNRLC